MEGGERKETGKVLRSYERAGLSVKEEQASFGGELFLSKHGALLSMCWLHVAG